MYNRKIGRTTPANPEAQSDTERRFHAALRTASSILGYAECPPARLKEKLSARGYEDEIIGDVLDRLTAAGLLDEDAMAARRAEYLYRVKGFGPRRILPELRRLGFSAAVVNAIEFPEDSFDFPARCAELLKKRGETDQKALAYLARCGYTADQIRKAVRIVKNAE